MKNRVPAVVSIMLLCALSCAMDDEVPDLCGLYGGTIYTFYGRNAVFYIDIMRCDAGGVSGETEWVLGSSRAVKSFEGSWSDTDDGISLDLDEKALLHSSGNPDTHLYALKGTLSGESLMGYCYQVNAYRGSFSLGLLETVVE